MPGRRECSDGIDALDLEVQVTQALEHTVEMRLVDGLHDEQRPIGAHLEAPSGGSMNDATGSSGRVNRAAAGAGSD